MTSEALLDEYSVRRLGEMFADAANRREYDRFASLWTDDGLWEIGEPIEVQFEGRAGIRSGIEQMLGRWDFFAQMPHAFSAEIDGDRAVAYWTMQEVARSADMAQGNSNIALYLDELVRVEGAWKFRSRRYRTIYSDSAPLTGQTFHIASADLHRIGAEHIDTLEKRS
jgi:ketosteroid isomerase-like protein